MDQTTYQDSTSKSNYFTVRTQSDPYHTKWSDYKKPAWYHPYNGRDWRAEYMYTRKDNDGSPYLMMVIDFFENYRPYIYLALFGLSQLFVAVRSYLRS